MTRKHILVYLYRRRKGITEFLLLRRSETLGGFWQPITGTVEPCESFIHAAQREVQEETSIEIDHCLTGPLDEIRFPDDNGVEHIVQYFGAESHSDAEVRLSDEHDEFLWRSFVDALEYVIYPEYVDALRKLYQCLRRNVKNKMIG